MRFCIGSAQVESFFIGLRPLRLVSAGCSGRCAVQSLRNVLQAGAPRWPMLSIRTRSPAGIFSWIVQVFLLASRLRLRYGISSVALQSSFTRRRVVGRKVDEDERSKQESSPILWALYAIRRYRTVGPIENSHFVWQTYYQHVGSGQVREAAQRRGFAWACLIPTPTS